MPRQARLVGRVGRFVVIASRDDFECTDIVVDGLTLRASILRGRAPVGAEIGDEAFDHRFHVTGDRGAALVALTVDVRRALLEASEVFDELRIDGGKLAVHLGAGIRPFAVEALVHSLVSLADALSPAHPGTRAMGSRLSSEPLASVRLRILEAGLEGSVESGDSLARAALGDADPAIRVRAAERLHDRPTLLRLAEDAALAGDVRVRAVEAASHALERDEFLALLSRLFARVAAHPDQPEPFLVALCSWARKTRAGDAQPALLVLLAGSDAVRAEAIHGLGIVGDADAVQPLRAFTTGLFAGAAGRAAETAIASIQARLKGAGPGQVSLPDPGALDGALSEPESRGSLSIAKSRLPAGGGGGPRKR